MDIARDELAKAPNEISVEKLQVVFIHLPCLIMFILVDFYKKCFYIWTFINIIHLNWLSWYLGLIFSLSWTSRCVQQQLQQILCMKMSRVPWLVTFTRCKKCSKYIVDLGFWFQDTCSLLSRLSTLKDLQTGETAAETEEPLSITGVETFSVNYKVIITFSFSAFFSFLFLVGNGQFSALFGGNGYILY